MKIIQKEIIGFFIFVLLFVCFVNSEPSDPSRGRNLMLQYGKYSHFIQFNKSKYKLEWGNNGIKNISESKFDSIDIWKCYLDTETTEFTFLYIKSGSDTWRLVILPLNKKSNEIIYWNTLGLDLKNKTIIYEYGVKDSMLIIENFINKKRMAIGKDFTPCQSSFPHYCIDSLVFLNNNLKFQWVTPHKFDKNNKIEFKKYLINLQ
jgi:hypothetical protein